MERTKDTLPGTNMEVENHLFVVENGLPFGAILHFHVSSGECTSSYFDLNLRLKWVLSL